VGVFVWVGVWVNACVGVCVWEGCGGGGGGCVWMCACVPDEEGQEEEVGLLGVGGAVGRVVQALRKPNGLCPVHVVRVCALPVPKPKNEPQNWTLRIACS